MNSRPELFRHFHFLCLFFVPQQFHGRERKVAQPTEGSLECAYGPKLPLFVGTQSVQLFTGTINSGGVWVEALRPSTIPTFACFELLAKSMAACFRLKS